MRKLGNHHCWLVGSFVCLFYQKPRWINFCSVMAKTTLILCLRVPPNLIFHNSMVKHHFINEIPAVLGARGNGEWYTREVICSVTLYVNDKILSVRQSYRGKPSQHGSRNTVCVEKKIWVKDNLLFCSTASSPWMEFNLIVLVVAHYNVWVQIPDP